MASAQEVQFNENQKAEIRKALKDAKALLDSNKNNVQSHMFLAAGNIRNTLPARPISLRKTVNKSGEFLINPSEKIENGGGSGKFLQKFGFDWPAGGAIGPVIKGGKAALIYGTYDKGIPVLGYLLAWHSASDVKVFVKAGPLEELLKMGWDEINGKLEASGNTSHYWDPVTGASAIAVINTDGQYLSLLGASFGRLVPENKPQFSN